MFTRKSFCQSLRVEMNRQWQIYGFEDRMDTVNSDPMKHMSNTAFTPRINMHSVSGY